MPRFHIHVHNCIGEVRDEEGEDLPGIEAAESKAIEGLRSILSEEVLQGRLDLRGYAEIVDSRGEIRRTLRFAEVIELHLDRDPS